MTSTYGICAGSKINSAVHDSRTQHAWVSEPISPKSRRPKAPDTDNTYIDSPEPEISDFATSSRPSSSREALAKSGAEQFRGGSIPCTPALHNDGVISPSQISFDGFGCFGGRFVPECLVGFLQELTSSFEAAVSDPSFWAEYGIQRAQPTPLQMACKPTAFAGGATIWLKREDRNQFGSHKSHNIIGQLLLARRMGRIEIVTDCASAKHGKFTAYMCDRLGLRCVIVMGAADALAQEADVLEMERLGATILTSRSPSGMGSLRSAITEAFRYSVCNYDNAYYLMSGPIGPHPLPTVTRTFQALLGEEVAAQLKELAGCQPDAIVTAIGSGSGAVGMFRPFLHQKAIQLIGVEAAEAAALTKGEPGVLQGARTLMLQSPDGQILDSNSVSPDMNLSTVAPEVAYWKSIGRIEVDTATDKDALDGFQILKQHEEICPGLDSSHAVTKAVKLARQLGPGKNIVLLVTGPDGIEICPDVNLSARAAVVLGL